MALQSFARGGKYIAYMYGSCTGTGRHKARVYFRVQKFSVRFGTIAQLSSISCARSLSSLVEPKQRGTTCDEIVGLLKGVSHTRWRLTSPAHTDNVELHTLDLRVNRN